MFKRIITTNDCGSQWIQMPKVLLVAFPSTWSNALTKRLKTFKVYPQWHTSLSKAPPHKVPSPLNQHYPPTGVFRRWSIRRPFRMRTITLKSIQVYWALIGSRQIVKLRAAFESSFFWTVSHKCKLCTVRGARVKEDCTQRSSSHSARAFAHRCVQMNTNACIAPSLCGAARHYSGFRKTGLLKFVSVIRKSKSTIKNYHAP